jgi:hypothetical protein
VSPRASVVGLHSTAGSAKAPLNPTSWVPGAVYPSTITRYAYVQAGSDMYVLGGVSNGTRVATMNRYDSSANTWTPRAALPVTSEAPSAAYYNGKIYLAEGDTGLSFHIYDIATNTWTTGAPRTNPPAPANGYGSAAGAFGGKVYVVGGSSATSNVTSVYDIASNTWSAGNPAPAAFTLAGYHQSGQYLYVVGGFGASPAANSTATMRLDMATGTWTSGPAFTPQRADFALAMSGSKLYAIGGDANGGAFFDSVATVNELDTSGWPGGSWATSPFDLPSPRQGNEAGFFSTGRVGGEIWSTGGIQGASFTFLNEHLFRSQCQNGTVSRLSENFDGVTVPALPNCWTAANATGPAPLWVTSTTTPDSAPNAAFVDDPNTISDKRLDSPVFPVRGPAPQLTFRQSYALEGFAPPSTSAFDGGVLEISIDGGPFADILTAGGTFAAGGYDHTISSSFSNPLAGRQAWSANSGGYITTVVNLPATAIGHSVQFRWRMGSDSSVASTGWRIDSVSIDTRPTLTVAKNGSGGGGVTSAPAGIDCGATCSSRFDDGTAVVLTATPVAGSRFAGWTGAGCAGTGTCTVAMNADAAVTATFIQLRTLTVTLTGKAGKVTSTPAGINCTAGTCTAQFDLGTPVTLTATPSGKNRFGGWSGDCSGKSTCALTMSADHAVRANFLPPIVCKVPKVLGKTLKKARAAIVKAHCRVGTITKKTSSARLRGKVVGQAPKAGKTLKAGAKVSLKVGKGPAHKKKGKK